MMHYTTTVGLSIEELIAIREKLEVLGLDLKDLLEFLDRDKVMLFSELKDKNKALAIKLLKIDGIINDR